MNSRTTIYKPRPRPPSLFLWHSFATSHTRILTHTAMGAEGALPPLRQKCKRSPPEPEFSRSEPGPTPTPGRAPPSSHPANGRVTDASSASDVPSGEAGTTPAIGAAVHVVVIARSGSGAPASWRSTSGSTPGTNCHFIARSAPDVQLPEQSDTARADPHGREAVRLLDVPGALRQQVQRCPARADPHGREAVRLLDVPAAVHPEGPRCLA